MNNNKHIKKIFTFCLYTVITLSADIAKCCDFNLILNKSDEELPLPDMNTILGYYISAEQQTLDNNTTSAFTKVPKRTIEIPTAFREPQNEINEHPKFVQINPNILNNNIKSAGSAFSQVKRKIESQENLSKKIQINNNPIEINQNLDNQINPESEKTSKPLTKKRKKQTGFIENSTENSENQNKIQKIKDKDIRTIDFSLIDTKNKYDALAAEFPRGKSTRVIIECNQEGCNEQRTGLLSGARHKMMEQHIKPNHPELYEDLLNKKPLKKSIDLNSFIGLNFSSIDTQEKYDNVALNLPGNKKKQTPVIITCNHERCNKQRTGLLSDARRHMMEHIKLNHPELYEALINIKPIEKYITLHFSSIDTTTKYNAAAELLPQLKETYVTIFCDKCSAKRTGPIIKARDAMIRHRKVDHFVCKCNTEYTSSMQTKNCNICKPIKK